MFGDDNELGIPALVAKLPGVLGAVQARAAVVAGELAKHATIWDDRECFPQSSMAALSEAGLLGLTVPKRFGGEGLGVAAACVALEELATGCLSSAMLAQLALNGPPRAIDVLGDEEQRARYLPGVAAGTRSFAIAITEPDAGSDALAMATRLEPDGRGFRLHGTKCYITNGANATNVLVFCRLAGSAGPRGIGAVVVDSEQAGFGPPSTQPKMGGRGIGEARLAFDGIRVEPGDVLLTPWADSKHGARVMLRQFNPEWCGNAAMVLGVARSALAASLRHLRTRKQFGRELAEFQGLRWKVADMATRLEAARLLVARATGSEEDGFPVTRYTTMAKILATETAQWICDQAIQLHGHAGYTRELPIERYFRDVRGMSLAGGTSEIMRNILAGEVLGRAR